MARDSSLGKIKSDASSLSVLGRELLEDALHVKNNGGLVSRKEGTRHKNDRRGSLGFIMQRETKMSGAPEMQEAGLSWEVNHTQERHLLKMKLIE